jgi:predicted MFS family arabinose efflux permease
LKSLGAAGVIAVAFGYHAAFLTLAAVAVIVLLVTVAMPKQADHREAGSTTSEEWT